MVVYYDPLGHGEFYFLCFIATSWYQNWPLLQLALLMELRWFAQISNTLGKIHCKQNTWKDMRKGNTWAIKTDFIFLHGKNFMVLAFYSFSNYLNMSFHSINIKIFLLFEGKLPWVIKLSDLEKNQSWKDPSTPPPPSPLLLPFILSFLCVCFQDEYRLFQQSLYKNYVKGVSADGLWATGHLGLRVSCMEQNSFGHTSPPVLSVVVCNLSFHWKGQIYEGVHTALLVFKATKASWNTILFTVIHFISLDFYIPVKTGCWEASESGFRFWLSFTTARKKLNKF